jgi:hypothetical protein
MNDANSTGFTLTVCTCINEWISFDISVSSRGECLSLIFASDSKESNIHVGLDYLVNHSSRISVE